MMHPRPLLPLRRGMHLSWFSRCIPPVKEQTRHENCTQRNTTCITVKHADESLHELHIAIILCEITGRMLHEE